MDMRTSRPAPRALLTAAALAAAAGTAARAEPKPLWEFGLGAGALVFNDYRGADSVHADPVAVPYLVYRGKLLRSDHNGLRGRLLQRSGEHTSELQSPCNLVCRLLLEKKNHC